MKTKFRRLRGIRIALRFSPALIALLALALASTVIKVWPANYFWIERENARMPVWVRGNIDSGTFVVLNHGGPGSCGTAESIFEVNPGDGRFGHVSPLRALERDFALVYWDQRHSGMSGGSADPDDSRMEDFGEDLSLVIREVRARYRVARVFLIGQSWGHAVALSYLTLIEGWQDNQAGIDGYILYKGNLDSNAPYQAVRPRLIRIAEQEIAAGRDVAYWNEALRFYQGQSALIVPADWDTDAEFAARAMGVRYSVPGRIWAFFKASILSPLNGWKVYANNKKTLRSKKFMAWVTSDTTLSRTQPRLSKPALLIYGADDLFAPVEVGQAIYRAISTPESQKTLLILPHSRHGAEGVDVPVLQRAIRDFICRTLQRGRE
jgi:pimeloyl-ACP methyl ester carboxylesterase